MDTEKICTALRSPFLMSMDTEYTRLAQTLRTKFEGKPKQAGAGAGASQADAEEEEDQSGAML